MDGRVSTNGIENFWSLLKRGLNVTYIAVEPFHLFRYVDEQVFRYNSRKDSSGKKMKDAERFNLALSQIVPPRRQSGGPRDGRSVGSYGRSCGPCSAANQSARLRRPYQRFRTS